MPQRQELPPVQRQPAHLRAKQMRAAFERIDGRIKEIESSELSLVKSVSDPGIAELGRRMEHMLAEI